MTIRHATEDDFGLPETAFNVCTFWLIEALHATGRLELHHRHAPARLLVDDLDREGLSGTRWRGFRETHARHEEW